MISWPEWRAPLFLVMEPSRFAPYDESTAWTRKDEATTLSWLDRFVDEFTLAVQSKLNHVVGEARVLAAMTASSSIVTDASEPLLAPKDTTHPQIFSFSHSDDYRSIIYEGKSYTVTRNQATMLEMLDRAYLAGHFGVSKDRLLAAVEAEESEVRYVFKGSPLWKTLVISGVAKGMYRLNLEPHHRPNR